MWSKKHDNFCLENKIKQSSQLLWRWFMTEGQPGEAIEIDLLLEFNVWVAKHRTEGGFSRPTLKAALAQLEDVGIVVIERTYTWRVHSIVYRSLKWLKKEPTDENPIYENHTLMPQFVSDKLKQQQHDYEQQTEIRSELRSFGIEIRDRDWKKILHHGIENIRSAVQHLLVRATTSEINNPVGWLRSCLRNQWWLDVTKPFALSLSQLAYGN